MKEQLKHIREIINSLKKNKLLFLLIPFGLFILFVFFFSLTSSPTKNTTPPQNIPQSDISVTPTISSIPDSTGALDLNNPDMIWSPKHFSEQNFQNVSFEKTQLSDGSIKYAYSSSNATRPNEIIVKDGTVIYQRAVVAEKYIYNYTGDMDAPEYVFQGSRFYGPNTMVYVYLNEGVAFVADADTTVVREQINFQPLNIEDFKKKYGGDIVDFTIIPTTAGHERDD